MKIYFKLCVICCFTFLSYFSITDNAFSWFSGETKGENVPQEYRTITNRLNQAQSQYEKVRQDIEQAIEQAKEKLQTLINNKTALTKEISATEEAVEKLKETNEKRYEELAQQEQKLNEIEELLKAKSDRITDLMDAVKAEKLIAAKDKEIADLNAGINAANAAAKSVQNNLLNDKKNLQNEIDALNAKNTDLQKAVNGLKHTVSEQKSALEALQQEKQAYANEIAALKSAILTFETEKNNALSNVESSLKEFESFITEQK